MTTNNMKRDGYRKKFHSNYYLEQQNVLRRLLYFGRKSSVDSISRQLSRLPSNSGEKGQVEQTKISFINQNQMAYTD